MKYKIQLNEKQKIAEEGRKKWLLKKFLLMDIITLNQLKYKEVIGINSCFNFLMNFENFQIYKKLSVISLILNYYLGYC